MTTNTRIEEALDGLLKDYETKQRELYEIAGAIKLCRYLLVSDSEDKTPESRPSPTGGPHGDELAIDVLDAPTPDTGA